MKAWALAIAMFIGIVIFSITVIGLLYHFGMLIIILCGVLILLSFLYALLAVLKDLAESLLRGSK